MARSPRYGRLMLGAALLAAPVLLACVSALWTPYKPAGIDILHRLAPPQAAHPFGTDPFGRDVLSRAMVGLRYTFDVAVGATLLGAAFGVPLGIATSAAPARLAVPLRRAADLVFAFPPVLTAAMLAALWGGSTTGAIIAIGAFNVPVFARTAAAASVPVLAQDYIAAATLAGRGRLGILWEHVLPNIAAPMIVQASLQAGIAVLAEAGLNYLGFGVPPPTPSLGAMLKDYQNAIFTTPFLVLIPGALITLTVLGCNLLGDGLRERFAR